MQTYKEAFSTISSKGQVTIPSKIREYLGVRSKDKITFVIEPNGDVILTPTKYPDMKSLRGIAGSLKKSYKWKEMIQIAYKDRYKK